MSKLKRKKTVVEEIKSEQQCRIKDQNESLRIPNATLQRRAEGSPVGGGSSCWTSSDLSDVEKLWMKTLQALCPQFPAQMLPSVPRLPELPPKEEKQIERRWCSLDEDVIPFPNPLAPYSLSHCHLFPSSPVSGPELPGRGDCPTIHTALNSLSHGKHRSDAGECVQDVNRVAAGKSRSGTEHSAGAGTLNAAELKSRAMPALGMTSGSEPKSNNEAGKSGRGSGSDGRLECCPMCLLPFPAKFSQMECDGHLAQCLSEMNADMMW